MRRISYLAAVVAAVAQIGSSRAQAACLPPPTPTLSIVDGESKNVVLSPAGTPPVISLVDATQSGTLSVMDLRQFFKGSILEIRAPSIFVQAAVTIPGGSRTLRIAANQSILFGGKIVAQNNSVHLVGNSIDECGGGSAAIIGGKLAIQAGPGGVGFLSSYQQEFIVQNICTLAIKSSGWTRILTSGKHPKIGTVDGMKGVETNGFFSLQPDRW